MEVMGFDGAKVKRGVYGKPELQYQLAKWADLVHERDKEAASARAILKQYVRAAAREGWTERQIARILEGVCSHVAVHNWIVSRSD